MSKAGGSARGVPRLLLRAEGAALLVIALALYVHIGASWWLFAFLILAPDLSMLGYLAGGRVGAMTYNALHTTLGPIALVGVGGLGSSSIAVAVGVIWLAHVGADRMLGYGLKYAAGFGETHLGEIGRR